MARLYDINTWLGSTYTAYGGDLTRGGRTEDLGRAKKHTKKRTQRISLEKLEAIRE